MVRIVRENVTGVWKKIDILKDIFYNAGNVLGEMPFVTY